MQFLDILFGVILMFASAHGQSSDDQMRLRAVAQDYWEAVEAAPRTPIHGEAGKEASALALVALAAHESHFWSKVQDCSACVMGGEFCDHGLSVTAFQLREGSGAWGVYTREQLCESNVLATERALILLNRHRKAGSTLGLFKGYAHGGRRQAAKEMDEMYAYAIRKAGIIVKFSDNQLWAFWEDGRDPSQQSKD